MRDAVAGLVVLDIRREHVERVHTLPLHHRDPFDRLLVAQAFVESATIATSDAQLDAYGISVLRT